MSEDDIQSRVASTRANLETTLDEIEDKFNVPKRASALIERAKASYEENRTPWIVGATGVAIAVVGLVAWALFSGDDD
ncbi:MAG: hypothetical protein QOK08_1268 [Actinomycetota bacterium]|jgi:hypothetical protein|nr:hypothetical protein [Glaciihabitans sp.]MDQ1543630.1 hypothetical protein [Actinomycetota bacterium]MDQ1560895.1 hypothetical protein [Actinomycetota bacterium]MDQ1574141.1 hypothetical protein [Actinomycetota bacterium]